MQRYPVTGPLDGLWQSLARSGWLGLLLGAGWVVSARANTDVVTPAAFLWPPLVVAAAWWLAALWLRRSSGEELLWNPATRQLQRRQRWAGISRSQALRPVTVGVQAVPSRHDSLYQAHLLVGGRLLRAGRLHRRLDRAVREAEALGQALGVPVHPAEARRRLRVLGPEQLGYA